MQIPDFYTVGYLSNGDMVYTPTSSVVDEKSTDFYWTGAHRMHFSAGVPGSWDYSGDWTAGTSYKSGVLISYQEADTETQSSHGMGVITYRRFPEKQFFYCIKNDTPASTIPSDGDGYWMKTALRSYINQGTESAEVVPDAFHAYDLEKGKVDHRYEVGARVSAKAAEMGEQWKEIKRGHFGIWEISYNQEDDPNQFYIAHADHFNIYETCHGTRPLFYMGASGNFNYYNATYPAGYYAPPFGEVPTLTLVGSSATEATINALTSTDMALGNFMGGGCCHELDDKEQLEMWGIRTVFPKNGPMVTWDETRGSEHGIHAPYEECPPELPPSVYFEQELFGYHPGSIMAPGAGTFYNDNPFPNSCDINGWYGPGVYKAQRCWLPGGVIVNGYKLNAGFPEMLYPTSGSNENKLNAGICQARLCETSQLLGFNFAGVQGGMATGPGAAVNDQASFATYDPFIYWHFIFRYNHDQLWNQTENTLTNKVVNFAQKDGITEEHLWEYRQCPNTPDYLPYSADIPIHACPNHYFDIPYYAAIGKFGFYGARFFNSCSTPNSTVGTETQEELARDFNYYDATECIGEADGSTSVGETVTMKAVASRSYAGSLFLRVNGKCYDVKFKETSQDDRPVDFVLSSTAPGWEDTTHNIELRYDIYEHNGFWNRWDKKNTIVWDTVSFNISACDFCANGGQDTLEKARADVTAKLEAKFGVSLSEMKRMAKGVGLHYCDSSPNCDPYLQHGSEAFNPRTTIDAPFDSINSIARTSAIRAGADDIHASRGTYSTFAQKADIVRDYSAGVQDCDEYEHPAVKGGTCEDSHYRTLLEIAKNEQRLGEFFAGNIGFFLWANYDHIVNSDEYKNQLTGSPPGTHGETHFKQSLYRLKRDFDQILLSLPNLLEGLNDPVIYYESAPNGMFGNAPLNYSRQGLWSNMLFNNNRYRQFQSELEWNVEEHLFSASPDHKKAWNKILQKFGNHIATSDGGVEQTWYKTAVEGKEKRLLTRFVENKLRGKAIDLYPTNQPSFSWDSASPYISGAAWGNSKWGSSVVGSEKGASYGGYAKFAPMPTGARNYFHGVYSRKSTTTGLADKILNARSQGGTHYYAGLYQDFSCGGDMPIPTHRAGGIAVDVGDKNIPGSPWKIAGHNDVGNVHDNFSCFSPIFIQEAQDTTCKIGQRPVFRVQAVDYHTIPEDKVGKGYPEIDFWTNNLKLTNSQGEAKYPINYKWYRVSASSVDRFRPNSHLDELFYSNSPLLQEASITGEWACLEGVSGVGADECTMFHPQASYTHDQVEEYSAAGRTKFREDHWSKLVDYKGEVFNINSAKKQGDHRLWRTWSYLQGAITTQGLVDIVPDAQWSIPAVPTFVDESEDSHIYADMLDFEYGISRLNDDPQGDDDYYYFCVASGRFGFRRSEYASLIIEDWLKLDFSVRNGAPVSIPLDSVNLTYGRPDQKFNNEDGAGGNEANTDDMAHEDSRYAGTHWRPHKITLNKGWGSNAEQEWQQAGVDIGPFWGLQRDANQVWENEVLETINMANNCRSFAFIGKEGFRGTTRTFRPPTQHNIKGDQSEYHGWFEYGLLVPYGNLLSQAEGNGLYSQSQLPVAQNYVMPPGCRGVGFSAGIDLSHANNIPEVIKEPGIDHCGNPIMKSKSVTLIGLLNEDENFAKAGGVNPKMFHFFTQEPAFFDVYKLNGVPPSQQYHHGELYPWAEQDPVYWYAITTPSEGRGVTWQFANNLGTIKRFGHDTKEHIAARINWKTMVGAVSEGEIPFEYKDTDDYIFWGGYEYEQQKEWKAAKRMIGPHSLAGPQAGWRKESCGRFMLYFVEALQRYWISCEGKSRIRNKSFIAPGLRHGSSAVQYFWGGYPNNTYVKRRPLVGPYAYEWKVHQHNRDRNGNGFSTAFYSPRHERPMQLYDPPSIYGLWGRQADSEKTSPSVERVRKLRARAQDTGKAGRSWKLPYNIKGARFGPYGTSKNGGCGSYRIGCIENVQINRPARYAPGDEVCDWYRYAIAFGPDQGWNYGCNEEQLMAGVCFDPCLSLKYNYGFFPGGKLLTVNSYVKYKSSRHDTLVPEDQTGGVMPPKPPELASKTKPADGSAFVTQLTGDVDDEEVAITKYKAVKFVRMVRGPWATPYRRVKAQMALAAGIRNPSTSDVINQHVKKGGTNLQKKLTDEQLHHGFFSQKAPSPKLYAEKRVTHTSVSPCNTNGADHCQYLTPTMHLGMDVKIEFGESVFGETANTIGGGYTKSDDFSVADEWRRNMMGFTRFLVNLALVPETATMGAAMGITELIMLMKKQGKWQGMKDFMQKFVDYTQDACPGGANGSYWQAFGNGLRDAWNFLGLDAANSMSMLEEDIASRARNSQSEMLRSAFLEGLKKLDNEGRLIKI